MSVSTAIMPAGDTITLADALMMSTGTTIMRANSTIVSVDATTTPASTSATPVVASTSNSTGWLWRKMSKLSKSAKRRWRGRFRGLSSTMRDFHFAEGSNGETFVDIFQNFSYYVLWLLEGIVVVVGFCVFFLRFGGRL